MDVKNETELTAASCHIVVTVAPALSMEITLNGSNQFITKLIYEQKITISDASTRSKSTTTQHLARPGTNSLFTVSNVASYVTLLAQHSFRETHMPSEFPDKYLMINSCHAWIKHLNS